MFLTKRDHTQLADVSKANYQSILIMELQTTVLIQTQVIV